MLRDFAKIGAEFGKFTVVSIKKGSTRKHFQEVPAQIAKKTCWLFSSWLVALYIFTSFIHRLCATS